jgi:ferredoxin
MHDGDNMKIFYFTGTGNSLQIARGVGAGGPLISIPRFLREHHGQSERVPVAAEVIGLVFPTYWLTLPPLIVEFFQKVRLETEYLFAITTRGNLSIALKSHLLHTVRQNGHALSYFNKVSMPDNYLPLFDMKKEKLRYNEAAIAQSVAMMRADICARKRNIFGFSGLGLLRPAFVRFSSGKLADYSQHFLVNDSCNGCGTCTRVCSAQIIRLVDGVPVYNGACNACLACAHHCPQDAIHMKVEKGSEHYHNPTVSVDDIISANSL